MALVFMRDKEIIGRVGMWIDSFHTLWCDPVGTMQRAPMDSEWEVINPHAVLHHTSYPVESKQWHEIHALNKE